MFWFTPGHLILAGDFNFPLHPARAFSEVWGGWSSSSGFGGQSTLSLLPLAVPYYAGIAVVTAIGTTREAAQQIVFGVIFASSGMTMWFLLRRWIGDSAGPFIGSLAYMLSPFVMLSWHNGNSTSLIAYGLAPAAILLFDRLLTDDTIKPSVWLLVALVSVLLASSAANPPSIVASLVLPMCGLAAFRLRLQHRHVPMAVVSRRVATAVGIALASNAWWILPNVAALLVGDLTRGFADSAVTVNPPARATPVQLFDFITGFGFWGFRGSHQGEPYFTFAARYSEIEWRSILALPLLLAITAAVTSRSRRTVAFGALIWVLGTFLTMGFHGPLGLYSWAYDHIPGFVAFRSPYEKFGALQAFGLSVLIALIPGSLVPPILSGRRRQWLRRLVVSSVAAVVLLTIHPLYTGLFENRLPDGRLTYHVQVPPHVFRSAEFFKSKKNCGVFFPQRDYGPYLALNWFRGGSSLVNDVIPCTKFAGNSSPQTGAQRVGERATNMISGDRPGDEVARFLGAAGVSHVLVRRDYDNQVYRLGPDQETIDRYFAKNSSHFPVALPGDWELRALDPLLVAPRLSTDAGKQRLRRDAVQVFGVDDQFDVLFLQSFAAGWRLKAEPVAGAGESRIGRHRPAEDYGNTWRVGGTGSYLVHVQYWPGLLIRFGLATSVLTLAGLVSVVVMRARRSEKGRRGHADHLPLEIRPQ